MQHFNQILFFSLPVELITKTGSSLKGETHMKDIKTFESRFKKIDHIESNISKNIVKIKALIAEADKIQGRA
jgi:hypothetical protein